MKNTNKLVLSAMFAALCCVATMVIRVPTLGTNGYVNIGDSIVLLSSWIIGNPYGALAAGIGSALADLLAGYGQYVPGTFIIKFAMAFCAAIIYSIILKTKLGRLGAWIISSIAAECIMVTGYFLYESTLLGYGIGAAASIPSNIIQGVTCIIISIILIAALAGTKQLSAIINKKN